MHLNKIPAAKGRTLLVAVESWREGGKTKNKTVETFGYLDEFEGIYEDPIAHFKEVCREKTAEKQARTQTVTLEIHPDQKISKKDSLRKNIGCAVPLSIYNATTIERVCRNATAGRKLGYDLNAVLRLLILERILNPGSKRAAWENKDRYFFRSNFEAHDVYRALSELCPLKERLVSAFNRYVDKEIGRDLSCAYYDVTNYYFEIDDPDNLRQLGVSKERRKSPLVQMGLLQDARGLPLGYKLFSGATPDCVTLVDVLAALKRDYALERVVVVADKGLNTSTNIAACVGRGDGFIYSQSIRGTKSAKALREWVISNEGYRTGEDADFKIKSRQDTKVITVMNCDGKEEKVPIETKTVAFWSRKYAVRARKERERTLERARELVAHPGAYNAHTHFGAAKYVSGLKVDAKTGEVIECDTVLAFDEERLLADEACDGYYCIITSEYDTPDERIVDTYRELWRIEESFKVTKSDLESRPVYCSTQDHIEAHFLTCYLALGILRVLQLKTDYKFSAQVLASELKKMCGTNVDANWWSFDHRSETSDAICASVGLDLTRRNMQLKDIKKVLAQANRS